MCQKTSPLTSRGIIAQLLDEGQKDPGRILVSNHRQHPRHARKLQQTNVAEPTKHDRSASSQHPGTKRPETTKQVERHRKQQVEKQQELSELSKKGLMRGHRTHHKTLPDTARHLLLMQVSQVIALSHIDAKALGFFLCFLQKRHCFNVKNAMFFSKKHLQLRHKEN